MSINLSNNDVKAVNVNIQRINNIVEKVNKLVIAVAVAFLLVTVVIVIANVVSRYVLHASLTWSAELARYTMIWSALLGAAVLTSRQQHLRVNVLEKYLQGRLRVAAQIITSVGSITFFLIMLAAGSMLVIRTSGQVASSIELLPMNVVYLIIPVAALLMLLGSLVVLLRTLDDEESML